MIPKTNTILFAAQKFTAPGTASVEVLQPITRENVRSIRRMVRTYTRDGYHVFCTVNNHGRLVANVFGSDIYTQAARRAAKEAR